MRERFQPWTKCGQPQKKGSEGGWEEARGGGAGQL